MRLWAGTSGYSYKEWKGPFYPEQLKPNEWLAYYAARLPCVEINNTFYRMPRAEVLARWAADVPAGFLFVLKAPQRITHVRRLRDVEADVNYLWRTSEALGRHRGPMLFQLPPFLRRDVIRLRDFLALVPGGCRLAFEFRHESWQHDEVYQALGDAGAALCTADGDEGETALVATARWGYLRLRRPDYDDAAIARWAAQIGEQTWDEAFVYFKHEDEARGPKMAEALLAAAKA